MVYNLQDIYLEKINKNLERIANSLERLEILESEQDTKRN